MLNNKLIFAFMDLWKHGQYISTVSWTFLFSIVNSWFVRPDFPNYELHKKKLEIFWLNEKCIYNAHNYLYMYQFASWANKREIREF